MNDIFVKDKMTDFEKLLFAQRALKDQNALIQEQKEYISKLQIELGKYKSLVQEYETIKKSTKEENKEFRANAYNAALLAQNKAIIKRNHKLMEDNALLIYKLRQCK